MENLKKAVAKVRAAKLPTAHSAAIGLADAVEQELIVLETRIHRLETLAGITEGRS